MILFIAIILIVKQTFQIMTPEIIEWLSKMPKDFQLSGSKEAYYNGEKH